MTQATPRWRRILLKVSGKAFAGGIGFGLDPSAIKRLATDVMEVFRHDVEVAVVVGGGNIIRGSTASEAGLDRASADYMGMLATVINGMALQATLEEMGADTRLQTAIHMSEVAEPFIRRRAIRHLEKGRIVILAAGTGNPYFTTDTAAVLRAVEIHAEAVLKATNVDGVYDKDPRIHPDARKFPTLGYMQAISQGLGIMDATAFTLCMENRLPIVVFDVTQPGNTLRVVLGESIGTIVGVGGTDK